MGWGPIRSARLILDQVPAASAYASAWDRQDQAIRGAKAKGIKNLTVEALKQKNPIRGAVDPSPNPKDWANDCIAKYYGSESLVARSGDANPTSGTSTGVSHTANVYATTTTNITSHTPDPSVSGQRIEVGFLVTPIDFGLGTPTGTVTVSVGADSCTATLPATSCSLTLTSVGAKKIKAAYSGDSRFATGTSAGVAHTVGRASTTTRITTDLADASAVGQSVTVAFTVGAASPGSGTPTDRVTVKAGKDTCTAKLPTTSCQLKLTSAGAKTIKATYSGNANFNWSDSAGVAHTVNKAATTTGTPDS